MLIVHLRFGQDSPVDRHVSIVDVCRQLDRWIAEDLEDSGSPAPSEKRDGESERDCHIDQSLWGAIAAFSARWLPITSGGGVSDPGDWHIVVSLWRDARRNMLKVINRPSYRSMLTLFLFALTPVPAGISDDEDADGISGLACVHAALHQIQTLRARHRDLQFSGSMVSLSSRAQPNCASPESIGTSSFLNAESIAYWAALTFDTSASLTLNCRPLLSSGLFGFESEIPWRLVRTCGNMFDQASQNWSHASCEMTDERADQIVAAAAAWKLLGWKLTAVFKEALRDGHDESEVAKAYAAVVDSVQQFNSIYRRPLEACQRRMPFLSQTIRLRWCKYTFHFFLAGHTRGTDKLLFIGEDTLMLHYHLSILMLVDMIEAANRSDLLIKLVDFSTDAENVVMSTLDFGLHNSFNLVLKSHTSCSGPTSSAREAIRPPITVPLVSVDPYPHHVVAGVQLLQKAIDRDFASGKIAEESYRSLQSTLERTLSCLPQSSKSVQAAKTNFSATMASHLVV